MPYKEKPIEKLYYTIGEVSAMLGENPSLVRFWADKFPSFIKPHRNKKGNRMFTIDDVNNFKTIHYLVKQLGMTLEGAQKRLKDNKDGVDNRVEVVMRLTAIKEELKGIASNFNMEE